MRGRDRQGIYALRGWEEKLGRQGERLDFTVLAKKPIAVLCFGPNSQTTERRKECSWEQALLGHGPRQVVVTGLGPEISRTQCRLLPPGSPRVSINF